MASWVRRVTRRFQSEPAAAGRRVATSTLPAGAAPAASAPSDAADCPSSGLDGVDGAALDAALFDWLIDIPPGSPAAGPAREAAWLAAIDEFITADRGRGELLPMAAGVIPKLLGSLRDENQSLAALTERVARDPHLVAEVTRMANAAATRSGQSVASLADGVQRIGTAGVRQAIARVVLKPMFAPQRGALMRTCTERAGRHAQAQAQMCLALSAGTEVDSFDAYLGGLLHDTGWLAALRALERALGDTPWPPALQFSPSFKDAFALRRHRLFAHIVTDWQLGPALVDTARAVRAAGGYAHTPDALAQLLHHGGAIAAGHVLGLDAAIGDLPPHVALARAALRDG